MTFYNDTLRTIQPGEQLYYFYGSRSNLSLLLIYGFAMADNIYDSFIIHMNMDLTNIKDFNLVEIGEKMNGYDKSDS